MAAIPREGYVIVRFLFACAACTLLGASVSAQDVPLADMREYPETSPLNPDAAVCNAHWSAPILSDGTVLQISSHQVAGEPRIALYAREPGARALRIVFDYSLSNVARPRTINVHELDVNQDGQVELLVAMPERHGSTRFLYGRETDGQWRLVLETTFSVRQLVRAIGESIEYGFFVEHVGDKVVLQARGEEFPGLECLSWSAGQGLWEPDRTLSACPTEQDSRGEVTRLALLALVFSPNWREIRAGLLETSEYSEQVVRELFTCLDE